MQPTTLSLASPQPNLFLLALILKNAQLIMFILTLKSVSCFLDKTQSSSLGLSDPLSYPTYFANCTVHLLLYLPSASIFP